MQGVYYMDMVFSEIIVKDSNQVSEDYLRPIIKRIMMLFRSSSWANLSPGEWKVTIVTSPVVSFQVTWEWKYLEASKSV